MAEPTEGMCPNCAALQQRVDSLLAALEDVRYLTQLAMRRTPEAMVEAELFCMTRGVKFPEDET